MKQVKKHLDEQAVSPVIATILMVAITVVLAAVLYVMVSGMLDESNTTPVGSFQKGPDKFPGAKFIKLKFGRIVPTVTPVETLLVVEYTGNNLDQNDANIIKNGVFKENVDDGDVFDVQASGLSGWLVSYNDMADDKQISDGDYLQISWWNSTTSEQMYLAPGEYIISAIFQDTGDTICSTEFIIYD